MRELSLHILDIAQNSITAGASVILITLEEDRAANKLTLEVRDNGRGMSAEQLQKVRDPFFTTRTTRDVGLGIPLLQQTAAQCNGRLTIDSQPGYGTKVKVEMQRNHINLPPIGDMGETLLILAIGNPQITIIYNYRFNDKAFTFDSSNYDNEQLINEYQRIKNEINNHLRS